jgi:hypothetical protein
VVRLALLAIALAGCKGELNAAYCAEHRDDPDCLAEGLVRLDAPRPECSTNADCAGNAKGPACDTATEQCVQCIDGVEESACTAQMQVCGADQTCHGCIVDSDCSSFVCLANQSCAGESVVLYAAPAGSGTACSRTSPCSLDTAVQSLSSARHTIKLTTLSGFDYSGAPITIDEPYLVEIIGTGTTFTPNASGDAITASGANLDILGLRVSNAMGSSIKCTAGVLGVHAVSLVTSRAYGIEADGCDATIERSTIESHPGGAIEIANGTYEIRNNVIENIGDAALVDGAVHITNGSGRVVFNTIAHVMSENGGGSRVGGIKCDGGVVVAQNLIASWGDANASTGGTCTFRDNVANQTFELFGFAGADNLHLTAASPLDDIVDNASVVVDSDCQLDGEHIDDIDGQARPNVACDRGADELR